MTCRESRITVIPHSIPLIPAPLIKTWPNHLKHLLLHTKHTSRQTFKQQKEELRGNGDVWSVSHTCTAETKASKDTRDLRSVGFLQDTHARRDGESALLYKLDSHRLRLRDSGPHARCSLCHTRSCEAECVCASVERRESQCHTHTPLSVKLLGVELRAHTHMHPAKPDCSGGSDKARFWK